MCMLSCFCIFLEEEFVSTIPVRFAAGKNGKFTDSHSPYCLLHTCYMCSKAENLAFFYTMALPAFIYLDTLGKGMATDYLKIPLQLGPELATRPIVIRFSSSFIKRRNRHCCTLGDRALTVQADDQILLLL